MSEIEYLPYKTINVLINRDYLHQVLENILINKGGLSKENQIAFSKQFKQHIKVLGFRNPLIAPIPLQVRAYASAFEEKDDVIPFTLSTWAQINTDFAEEVRTWMEKEGWRVLPLERHFDETEGFINEWPNKLTFEKLTKKYKKDHPNDEINEDDLILMVIWISGQLPPEDSQL